jgi:hypothetical protein
VNLRLVEGENNLLLLGIGHLCMLIQHQVLSFRTAAQHEEQDACEFMVQDI